MIGIITKDRREVLLDEEKVTAIIKYGEDCIGILMDCGLEYMAVKYLGYAGKAFDAISEMLERGEYDD